MALINNSDFLLDSTIPFGDNFYHHVNNKWISQTNIPDDTMVWNVFKELNESNLLKIKTMLDVDQTDPEYKKLMILYKQTELKSIDPVYLYIDKINSCDTIQKLRQTTINIFTIYGISSTNTFYVYNNFNDASTNVLHVGSGGLGLPDREYYFDKNKADIRQKYKEFMKSYLDYFKLNYDIDEIYNIEEKLANSIYTNVQDRDSKLMNNSYKLFKIYKNYTDLYKDLLYFFKKINRKYITWDLIINITNPKFTTNYYKLLTSIDIKYWKQYFIYLFLRKMGNYINTDTETLLFNFYEKVLSGTVSMKEPFKRSIEVLNSNVGMILGRMFAEQYFKEESKNKVIEMIKFIKEELNKRLLANTWMEASTKQKAIEKLKKMNFKVGYPDKWRDYTNLDISESNPFFTNIMNCMKFDFVYSLQYLYRLIDRNQWFMNPHEINAYYSPSYNEIVFPCGILMEPFFSLDKMAHNFGGIGCIIGHEITHGFDDMGRYFDGDGNLKDWWTVKDSIKYKKQSNILKTMFSQLKIEDKNINGELTLGENIADLGGIEISFNSFKAYLKNTQVHDDYKTFFYNYANIWRCKIRKEESIKRLSTDPHSPPQYRVNTILSNMNDFYNVFNIDQKSKMWISESERARIW
jgi:putative endopeptidase